MWRLILLGDLALQRNGVEVRRLRAQKYAHLLAYLALWPNRAHSRCELLEIFWPDEPVENAQMCLRTALASLRRQLGCPDLLMPGHRDIVKLTPGILHTDVQDFECAVRGKDRDALRLYQGALLPGCYYDWALDEANRLQALYEQFCASGVDASTESHSSSVHRQAEIPSRESFHLPSSISNFYGREGELEELRRILESRCRLLTLVGLGGIGKTRLALELGRQLPQRVALAEFASVTRSSEIPTVIGAAIRLSRVPSHDYVERLEVELGKVPTVLILDNVEEIAETDSLAFVEGLLKRVSNLTVLATSRIPLGLAEEHVFAVQPLSLQAAKSLFLDRARCCLPDFAESACLTDLCDRLDCLPLAIELCATWAPLMSSRRMLEALSDRFHWLEARKRNIPERHRSLSAVLRWTCPPEGELLQPLKDLSVLLGRWSLEAAEAILGSECIELLDQLQARALIQVHVEEGEPTFSILQTVREYALEGVTDQDLVGVRERHCRFYCRLAGVVARSHHMDPQGAFRKLDFEQQNIFAAFEFGLDQSEDLIEVVFRAFEATKWCWWVRGYDARVRGLVAKMAVLPIDGLEGPIAARLFRARATHAVNEGRYPDALLHCKAAIDIWDAVGDAGCLSDALHIYAVYLGEAGLFEESETAFLRHLEGVRQDRHAYMIGLASMAAMLVDSKQNFEKAEDYYNQMIAYWQMEANGDSHVAVLKTALAGCQISRGEFQQAEDQLREAIPIMANHGERIREALAWDALAEALDGQGRTDEANEARETAACLRAAAHLVLKAPSMLA